MYSNNLKSLIKIAANQMSINKPTSTQPGITGANIGGITGANIGGTTGANPASTSHVSPTGTNTTPTSPVNTQGTNTSPVGTRIPYYNSSAWGNQGFVGGPDKYMVDRLQRFGLPMVPASSGVNPSGLSDAEAQARMIQSVDNANQRGKERNRQNLDAYFARLTALNEANAAAGKPAYTPTAQDLYAPYANMADPKSVGDYEHRMYRDRLLNSAAYVAASKGTPYNPVELNNLSGSIPATSRWREVREDDAYENNLSDQNVWKYTNFGLDSFHPYWNSLHANFRRPMPIRSLSDYSETAEED